MYAQEYNFAPSAGMPFSPLTAPSAMSVYSSFQSFTLPHTQLGSPSGGDAYLSHCEAHTDFHGGIGQLPAAFNSGSTLAGSATSSSASTLVDFGFGASPMDLDHSAGDLLAPDFAQKVSLYHDATDTLVSGFERFWVSEPPVYMDCTPDVPTRCYPRRWSSRATFSSHGSLVKADSLCIDDGSKDGQRSLLSARYNPYSGRSRENKRSSVLSTFTKDQQRMALQAFRAPKEIKKAASFVAKTYGTDLLRATVLCTPESRPISPVPEPTIQAPHVQVPVPQRQSPGALFSLVHKVASGVKKAVKTVKVFVGLHKFRGSSVSPFLHFPGTRVHVSFGK
ncbi:hypothetical protein K474DRAFT_1328254 [Panus rudis PR-1116 ss-1]|nr:hypothetical protein K474DRAFT_1328254 [Panus rudis PR-1116 ss-1]